VSDEQLAGIADEIDALAERLADRSLELLRAAVGDDADGEAAASERVVTRARRALERASALLRGTARDEE
jgi:hypothetical protein